MIGFVHLKKFMVGDWSFLQEEFSCASCAPCFHHSWEDSSSIHFCRCLILRRASEYIYAARALQPMTPVVFLEDIVATLHQLHPLPLDLVPPPISGYQLEHTFVLDKTLFAQALATTPHLFSGGLFGMVYEHFLR